MKTKLVTLFLILTFAFTVSATELQQAQVTRVLNGDTIEVELFDGETQKVKYIGINTPELSGEPKCYAKEATAYNKTLVNDKTVWLEFDVQKRDQYSRLLAYVYLDSNGNAMVNSILLAQGYAQVATYPPNVKYVDRFQKLEQETREDARRIWSKCKGLKPVQGNDEAETQEVSAPVAITCIHFDASGNDHNNKNGEWVVLKANQDISLKDWTLSDQSDRRYRFPEDFSLQKGEKVRVYTGAADDPRKDTGCAEDADYELFWNANRAIWNNSGDVAYIKRSGETVLTFSYSGAGKEAKK